MQENLKISKLYIIIFLNINQGHIPTAVNIEWYNFLDPKSFVFKSDEELMKVFVNHGVDLNKDIITYCQTGKTATVVNVALEILGK